MGPVEDVGFGSGVIEFAEQQRLEAGLFMTQRESPATRKKIYASKFLFVYHFSLHLQPRCTGVEAHTARGILSHLGEYTRPRFGLNNQFALDTHAEALAGVLHRLAR